MEEGGLAEDEKTNSRPSNKEGRQEEHMGEPAAGGSVNAPRGQGEDCNGYYQDLVRWSQWRVVR